MNELKNYLHDDICKYIMFDYLTESKESNKLNYDKVIMEFNNKIKYYYNDLEGDYLPYHLIKMNKYLHLSVNRFLSDAFQYFKNMKLIKQQIYIIKNDPDGIKRRNACTKISQYKLRPSFWDQYEIQGYHHVLCINKFKMMIYRYSFDWLKQNNYYSDDIFNVDYD